MEISFLICNFNYSQYVFRAIESIALLELPLGIDNKNIVVVDDGSHDDSIDVIEGALNSLASKFTSQVLVRIPENKGKLHCLNQGIPLLKGELTVILDADDYLSRNFLMESFKVLQLQEPINPNVGFVYSDCILIDENDEFLHRGLSTSWNRDLILTHSYIPECALTKTAALLRSLPYDESIKIGTKHHKWMKIINDGWEGAHSPLPLFYYRMHSRNLSGIGNAVLRSTSNTSPKILSGYWTTA